MRYPRRPDDNLELAACGAASCGATFPMTAEYCFRAAISMQVKQPSLPGSLAALHQRLGSVYRCP